MSAKKRTLMQAIEEIEKRRDSYARIPISDSIGKAISDERARSLNEVLDVLSLFQPANRKEIEEAYSHGDLDGRREAHDRDYKDHTDYFTSTYTL